MGSERASVFSISQEDSGLGKGRALVRSGPLLTSQGTCTLSHLWSLRSVSRYLLVT